MLFFFPEGHERRAITWLSLFSIRRQHVPVSTTAPYLACPKFYPCTCTGVWTATRDLSEWTRRAGPAGALSNGPTEPSRRPWKRTLFTGSDLDTRPLLVRNEFFFLPAEQINFVRPRRRTVSLWYVVRGIVDI
jgi:hypothetical protein